MKKMVYVKEIAEYSKHSCLTKLFPSNTKSVGIEKICMPGLKFLASLSINKFSFIFCFRSLTN
jgi:hypothetical protein